jgi:hypothetical protein
MDPFSETLIVTVVPCMPPEWQLLQFPLDEGAPVRSSLRPPELLIIIKAPAMVMAETIM